MAIDKIKLAVYLDEVDDDPATACKNLATKGIHYVVLRNAWMGNICDATDTACQRLRQLLNDNSLSVVTIASDLGRFDHLSAVPPAKVDRLFNLAAYFQAANVRVHIGNHIRGGPDMVQIKNWMTMITDRCLSAGLTPLLEVSDDSAVRDPVQLAGLLAAFRRWKLLYDPAQLIIKHKQDPFQRYWTLLKSFVGAVDLRDFKIGHGFKPVGFGDARLRETVGEGLSGQFKGWYYLEPSLGRKHGSAVTRWETFQLAHEALENLVS